MPFWTSWFAGGRDSFAFAAAPAGLAGLREPMLAALADCHGLACDRLRTRLLRARSAQDLWLARPDMYQLVATQHCESQAAQRINGLTPAFEDWLPPRLLRACGSSSLP